VTPEVSILSVTDAERLLQAAETSKHHAVLAPYISLCLFGELRPYEAQQLDWAQP
jgi:integrase